VARPLDRGAVEFRRRTASNFRSVEVVDWPVTPPANFRCAVAVAFYLQFFDAIAEKLDLFKCYFISPLYISPDYKLQPFNLQLF